MNQVDLVNMADQVNVQDAKTRLSELLARVERGEEITIARAGRPVARLVGIAEPPPREMGFLKLPPVPDSVFFDPLPDDELDLWDGGPL